MKNANLLSFIIKKEGIINGMDRKKVISSLLIVICVNILGASQILHETLPNGMEVVVKENDQNSAVGFYCFVKTGSITEGDYLGAGISHYLEHVVSSGSTAMRTETEYQELETAMGAIVNAYTSGIVTAYHITVDREYQDEALQILTEHLFHCSFAPQEVDREREVILKEIVLRSTPPYAQAFQRNNELVYPMSSKKYPVIGYTELFRSITREQLMDYYQQHYQPNNMIFVSAGDFEAADMMEKVKVNFSPYERRHLEQEYQPPQAIREGSLEYIEEFGIQQPLIFMTTLLPAQDYTDFTALKTAFEILFNRRKSPLRYKLVEELQLVNDIHYSVEGFMVYPESEIFLFLEAKRSSDVKEIVRIIDEEMTWYSREGFCQEDLDDAINRMKAQRLLSTPGINSDCNRIGWSMLYLGIPDSYELSLQNLESLTVMDLRNTLQKHLIPRNRIVFYALPGGEKELLEKVEIADIIRKEPEKIILADDLTLIFRQNNEKSLLRGVIWLPLFSDYETEQDAGLLALTVELMFRGSRNYNPLDISEWIEDHAVSLEHSVNGHGTFIEFKCLKDDYPAFRDILFDAWQEPTFTESELELARQEAEARYKRSLSSAHHAHEEFLNSILYPDSPRGLSRLQQLEIIQSADADMLLDLKEKFFRADDMIVTFFGDLSREEAEIYAREIREKIPSRTIAEPLHPDQTPLLELVRNQEYEFEQVNIDINYPAPSLQDEDFLVMKVIDALLRGQRGRLHKATRGTNDLAYYAFSEYYHTRNSGYLRLSSQTSRDHRDELVTVLKTEIDRLCHEAVTEKEIEQALEENRKMILSWMNDNQLPYYQTYYEALGLGYDFPFIGFDKMKEVTPGDISRVACKYLQQALVIISEPSAEVKLMVE